MNDPGRWLAAEVGKVGLDDPAFTVAISFGNESKTKPHEAPDQLPGVFADQGEDEVDGDTNGDCGDASDDSDHGG